MIEQRLAGQVAGVFITPPGESIVSVRQPLVTVTLEGIEGDKHAGLTRKAGVRDRGIPRGTEIKNDRQLSIVSEEELAAIAQRLGIQAVLAEDLGANLLLRDIINLTTEVPPEARIIFPSGAELVVTGENLPCIYPGKEIENRNPGQMKAPEFVKAAMKQRGLVAWAKQGGEILPGQIVRIELPPQRTHSIPNLRTDK